MKPGRVPLRASPKSVNCETASSAPFASSTERFIFPCSSSKMRRSATLSASQRASSSESRVPTPKRTQSPAPMLPVTRPSTATLASLTLCTTARTRRCIARPPRSVLDAGRLVARVERLEQRGQVVGVLLFLGEDLLHHAPRGGIVVAEEADDFQIRLDGDALGDEVFLDHVDERYALGVLRVAARDQPGGVEVGRAAELADALGDHIGVPLFLDGVLHELVGHGLGM